MVDKNIMSLCRRPQKRALRRILDEGGAMRRTKTWDEKFPRTNETGRPNDNFQPQAASQIFHDSSKDVTAKFNKLAVTEKTKEKTRGTLVQAAAPVAQAPEQDLDEKPVYKVDKNAYRVFQPSSIFQTRRVVYPERLHGTTS
jgi:hypothetical protein